MIRTKEVKVVGIESPVRSANISHRKSKDTRHVAHEMSWSRQKRLDLSPPVTGLQRERPLEVTGSTSVPGHKPSVLACSKSRRRGAHERWLYGNELGTRFGSIRPLCTVPSYEQLQG
jgi:hypothetical protein